MTVCVEFFRRDGSPEVERQWSAPGRSYMAQNSSFCELKDTAEGTVVSFHVGHGVFRDYVVIAADEHTVLVQAV